MNRREALSAVGFLLGGTVIGAEAFLSGCNKSSRVRTGLFTDDQILFLDEVGETIIPTTASSPGAKEARIGEFMDSIITDCYKEIEQKTFVDGMTKLDEASKVKFNKGFMKLESKERHELLLSIDAESKTYKETRKPEDPELHYYPMMKQLTVWGYFSSEVGATMALEHVAVPGRYEACIPLKPGQKAWS